MPREGCEEVGATADLADGSSSSGHRENSTRREAVPQKSAGRLASGTGAPVLRTEDPHGSLDTVPSPQVLVATCPCHISHPSHEHILPLKDRGSHGALPLTLSHLGKVAASSGSIWPGRSRWTSDSELLPACP